MKEKLGHRRHGQAIFSMALIFLLYIGAASPASADSEIYGCMEDAAQEHELPVQLIWAIAWQESRLDAGAVGQNRNGTEDVGLMQINSSWRGRLGEEQWTRVIEDPCFNIHIGTWILSDCLDRHGWSPVGIGCYNALSRDKRLRYAEKIVRVIDLIPEAEGEGVVNPPESDALLINKGTNRGYSLKINIKDNE